MSNEKGKKIKITDKGINKNTLFENIEIYKVNYIYII